MSATPLEAVRDVLARDSRLGRRATPVVDYLMDQLYYGEFRIFEQVASTAQSDFVNLVGVKGRAGRSPLWLLSCVSTGADPVPSHWAGTGGDPLSPRIDTDAGVIRGLGAASGKVDLMLKIAAAARIPADELTRPLCIVALFGEEARGTGVRTMLEDLGAPAAALVGAPTNLELWSDHPGCLVLQLTLTRSIRHRRMPPTRGMFALTVTGRSAHALRSGLGDDALEAGLEVMRALRHAGTVRLLSIDAGEGANRVPGLCRMQVGTGYDDLPPLPAGVSVEAIPDGATVPFPIDTLVRSWLAARDAGTDAIHASLGTGENARSARPERSIHTGELRSGRDDVSGTICLWTGPGAPGPELVERFAAAVQSSLAGEEGLEVDIQVVQQRPALSRPHSPSAELLEAARGAMRASGLPPVVNGGLVTSDAGFLAEAGVPALAFGPGRGPGDLYRDDESVPLAHLERAFAFYERFIRDWATKD